MVCTDYLTETGEGVLVELAGSLVLAQRMQIAGEVVGRGQGVGVVLPEYPAAVGERPFEQGAGGAGFSPGLQVSSGPVEQSADVLTSRVQGAVGVGRGQHMGQQRSPGWPGGRVAPRLGGDRCGEQQDRDHGHVLTVGPNAGWLAAQDGLDQSVQLQAAGLHPGQATLTPPRSGRHTSAAIVQWARMSSDT